MREIPDGSIDLILCDPPYQMTDLKWDTIIPFDKLWAQYKRIIKPDGAVLLFCNQPFTTEVVLSNKKDYRYNWYWIKNNATGFAFAKYQPMRCLEDICVFYEKMPSYHPIGLQDVSLARKKNDTGKDWVYKKEHFMKAFVQKVTGYPRNVLFFDNEVVSNIDRLHSTQKPVKLLEYFIKTYTDYGQTVLDNCMGSGSTGVACVNTGRGFIGMEIEVEMYEVACARIKEAENLNSSNLFDIQTMNEGGNKNAPPTGGGGSSRRPLPIGAAA
jgi:site-specific DNA-methyltransferase (adenine-specific)